MVYAKTLCLRFESVPRPNMIGDILPHASFSICIHAVRLLQFNENSDSCQNILNLTALMPRFNSALSSSCSGRSAAKNSARDGDTSVSACGLFSPSAHSWCQNITRPVLGSSKNALSSPSSPMGSNLPLTRPLVFGNY